MLLKVTNHAQKRLKERGIDIEHIKKAIKEPSRKEKLGDGKLKVERKVRKKKIVVVYCKDGFKFKGQEETYIVITAYYL
jgi:hypothetical protein